MAAQLSARNDVVCQSRAGGPVRYRADQEMATWCFMPGPAVNDPARFAEFVME